jgi:hypothetical protein
MIGTGGSGRQRTMRITTIEHGLVISTASRRRFGLRPHETYSCSCIPLYHLFLRSDCCIPWNRNIYDLTVLGTQQAVKMTPHARHICFRYIST